MPFPELIYLIVCCMAVFFALQKLLPLNSHHQQLLFGIKMIAGLMVYWFGLRTAYSIFFHVSQSFAQAAVTFSAVYSTMEALLLQRTIDRNRFHLSNLKIAKEHAEIESLKLQVDAHFLFNSLNTLNYLVEYVPHKSRSFSRKLADVYRYVLENKTKTFVNLLEELSFCHKYLDLLRERFGDTIQYRIEITDVETEDYLIIPISIQLLIENAVKHNQFSSRQPLEIAIAILRDRVMVKNNLNRKPKQDSLQLGLMNLNERFDITIGKGLLIDEDGHTFTVTLPLKKI